jgi:hypothetical protein
MPMRHVPDLHPDIQTSVCIDATPQQQAVSICNLSVIFSLVPVDRFFP